MDSKKAPQHEPLLVRAADAETLKREPTSMITLFADSDVTGGALTCNRANFDEGSIGAPSHFHTTCSEMFFVLDGALDVLVDDEIVTLERGDFLMVPAGTPHAFGPAANCSADVLVVFTPGMARFEYYRLLDEVYAGNATFDDIAASQARFDNHYVESVVWKARVDALSS